MTRSLQAPLSPNEENTLRRVALGRLRAGDLAPRDLMRLRTLSLVEIAGDRLELTMLGRQRYGQLPHTGGPAASRPRQG